MRKPGFTLIELLIVLLIVSLISGTVYSFAHSISLHRRMMEVRMDADEALDYSIRQWRQDIALAAGIEMNPDQTEMRITRVAETGDTYGVHYFIDAEGRFLRKIDSSEKDALERDPVIYPEASELRFERIGSGYRMSWKANYHDGLQNWSWRRVGFAAAFDL